MSRKEGIPVKHRCDLPDTIELLGHRIQSALSIVLFSSGLLTLILCLAPSAGAAEDDAQAQAKMRSWVSAKFLGEPQTPAPVPFLLPNLDVKDSVVMRNAIQGHALLIAGHVFDHGLAMRSTGEIRVVLPSGARSFHAIAGVDSNDVFSYSNAGRGSVIASLRTAGSELFRSPVLHEGSPGVDVKVELHGAREFTLRLAPVGERPPAYQKDWDQADWADAEVTLQDGSVLRLGELRIGAPAAPSADVPFSFVYGGRPSAEFLKNWVVQRSTRRLDDQRTEIKVTYTDPATQLIVRCVVLQYDDFPIAEWTVYFKNGGAARTPILEKIQSLDERFEDEPGVDPVIHHSEGSSDRATDFRPLEESLPPSTVQQFASHGGRPTDGDMPYFNLAWPGHGLIAVLGWPGQWALQISHDGSTGVRIAGGQQQTHFWLAPGEEVRTPFSVLQFWSGDWIDGQNQWRRWMLAHNLPRTGGKLPPPQLAGGSAHTTVEMQWANEQNQKEYFARILAAGMPIDYWWMDAGWYPFTDGWWNTGTWDPDPRRFPHGLRPVSDAVHAQGRKVIVWFEPERVAQGSWLDKNHPQWLIGPPGKDRLLFLGNPEAWHWLVEHVSHMIEREGIDTYRQDFNFEPLTLWQFNDTPDRIGITEIEHVEGYLSYFDELHRRFPNLLIDTCASGGRRNDLETLRRAVPLWRSDFPYDPAAMQMQTYGLSLWAPYFGTAINSADPYIFRSQITPAVGIGLDPDKVEAQRAPLMKMLGQWKSVAGFYYGDFYPLTPYSTEETAWIAWQFAQPDGTAGMVQVFRRKDSPFESARFKLRGLDPHAGYIVTDPDSATETAFTGAELIGQGLPVHLVVRPGAALLTYKKVERQQ
jgi:alpha-galactosidase